MEKRRKSKETKQTDKKMGWGAKALWLHVTVFIFEQNFFEIDAAVSTVTLSSDRLGIHITAHRAEL